MILIAYILDSQMSYFMYLSICDFPRLRIQFSFRFIVHLKLGLPGRESACNGKDPLVKMVKNMPAMQ